MYILHSYPNNHNSVLSSLMTYHRMCKKSLKIPKGGNQNLYIEEEQTPQWPKRKSTKGQTTRVARRVSLKEHELLTIPERLSSSPVLAWFVLLDLCNILQITVLLSFFFMPLHFLSFDIRLLIITLISSNISYPNVFFLLFLDISDKGQ